MLSGQKGEPESSSPLRRTSRDLLCGEPSPEPRGIAPGSRCILSHRIISVKSWSSFSIGGYSEPNITHHRPNTTRGGRLANEKYDLCSPP